MKFIYKIYLQSLCCLDGLKLFENSTRGVCAVFVSVLNFRSEIRNRLGVGTFLVALIPPFPDRGYKKRNWDLYFNVIAEEFVAFEGGVQMQVARTKQLELVKGMLVLLSSDLRGNVMINNAQAPALNGACDKCDIRGFQVCSKGATIYPSHCR